LEDTDGGASFAFTLPLNHPELKPLTLNKGREHAPDHPFIVDDEAPCAISSAATWRNAAIARSVRSMAWRRWRRSSVNRSI
jgi:hypothetical protein